jgi:preprotein translocase subunit SecB
MKAIPSEIKLLDFNILQSHYTFIPSKKKLKLIEIKDLFNEYELDIDFAHQTNRDETIQVFTKIEVNNVEQPAVGYKLYIEGVANFSFTDTDQLTEPQKKNLKSFSTVSILIGYLRNSLSTMTASSPLGQYLLPPININDLFAKKVKESRTI